MSVKAAGNSIFHVTTWTSVRDSRTESGKAVGQRQRLRTVLVV